MLTHRWNSPELELVHPAEAGWISNTREREWAVDHKLLLLADAHCVHALYRMHCPLLGAAGGCEHIFLDHASVWVPWTNDKRPFILSHLYATEIPPAAHAYGRAHGLMVTAAPGSWDRWYNDDTLPVRFTCVGNSPFPLEIETAALLTLWPQGAEPTPTPVEA